MKKIAIAVLMSAFVAAPAVAADSPFYVGAQLGDGYIGGIGGYQIDKMYSAEVTYLKFDSIKAGFIETDTSSIGVAGVALFPLKVKGGAPVSLFARAGVERTTAKATTTFLGTSTTIKATDTNLVLGGGAQYDFSKNFSARLGLDIEGQADSLYLSAIYKF